MTQFAAESRYKLSPGQRQKEKSAHPDSSRRISACAILTISKSDEGDLMIGRLDLDDWLMPCSGVGPRWQNCPFEHRRTRRKFRDWNSVYRVFENC